MWRMLLALFLWGVLVGPARCSTADDVISVSACNASHNLTLLSNLTVREAIEQSSLEAELDRVPLTIVRVIQAVLNGSREDTAQMLSLDVRCLDYLEFSLSEVALFLLNTTDYNNVSFEDVFRAVFTPNIEEVLTFINDVKEVLNMTGISVRGNETIQEIAVKYNVSLKTMTLLDVFDAALNGTVFHQTDLTELVPRSSFDLLNYTTSQIAAIIAVEEERLLNYSLFHIIRVSFTGRNFINQLRITVSTARTALRVTLVKLAESNDVLVNETTLLELVVASVPQTVHYALSFVLEVGSADLMLLNISLGELGELVNTSVTELEGYEVFPRLIVFVVQTRKELVRINRETSQEVGEAFFTILTSYNITIVELSVEFNLTQLQLMQMNLLQLERLCVRFTLLRYANNLNVSLAEVALKVNKTEDQLLNNLTVEEFQVVIRRLFVVRTFETMSQMLGVGDGFLRNMLNIRVPLATLSMCDIDGFLTTTRRPVLDLKETVRQRKLSFLVQINGFTIIQVYRFTLARFIRQILRVDFEYFFGIIDLPVTDDHISILSKYYLSDVERIFQVNGLITNYRFSIFQLSWSYIVQKIIVLDEQDINECEENMDQCFGNAECIDTPGSYECRCPPGRWSGRFCRDINECREGLDECPSISSYCVNTLGSYRCECRQGFQFNSTSNSCEDINECESRTTNLCFWRRLQCQNLVGSFQCTCPQGYRSAGSLIGKCLEIDECDEGLDMCPSISSSCRNFPPGSYTCVCRPGFRFNSTSNSCEDIDECSSDSAVCPPNSKCMDTVGSFSCRCLPGYERDDDDDDDDDDEDDDDDDSVGQNVARCRATRFTVVLQFWIRQITVLRTRVFVSGGFPYFGQLYNSIYINPNGLVAIGFPYYRAAPRRLTSLRRNVLAVFWANTIFSGRTQVLYQAADRSTVEFSEQLDNISSTVNNCSGDQVFRATWMLIVTWQRVAPSGSRHEQSTYQAILVTNGTSSYAIYNYQDGGMRWRRQLQRRCAVGYSTINGVDSFQDDRSFTDKIFRIDSEEIVDAAGNKRRGVMCHSLNKPDEPVTQTDEQRCLAWYNQEPDPEQWIGDLGDCPPTRRIARRLMRRVHRRSNIVCYEPPLPNRNRASQECCYYISRRRRNAFVSEAPLAGRVYRYHSSLEELRTTHDIEPYEVCCGQQQSTLCSLFYEKRPLTTAENSVAFRLPCTCGFFAGGCFGRSCRRIRRPRRRRFRFRIFRATAFGDPHINTLDGQSYTFNGLGDYILVRSPDGSHHLHGRTKRPININGTLANATVFSGFAVKTNESDIAQILYNDSAPGNLSITIITASGNLSCQPFVLGDFVEAKIFNEMSVERSDINNHSIVVSFPSGFTIEVSPGVGLLQLAVSVSQELENNTQGLWGTFNADKTDDFQYSNGSQLSINATEEEIFTFGQTWKVPDAEKMFVSPDCVLQNVFFDRDFRPAFLNHSGLTPEITALCGGNRECLYDASQTGNLDIAAQTAQFEQENQQIREELENLPPNMTGPAEINVILNQTIEFQVSATDPNNDTITLDIEDLPPGANFDNTTGVFSWLPSNATNVTLQFVATDSKETSTVLTVVVNMCQCQNNGECDFTEFVGDNTGAFRVVGCNCSAGFNGTFCENALRDPCADEPCYDNVTCATRNDTFGFICGPCPEGLTGDGEDCYEIDECANTSLSGCNQTCVNTFGSFHCECRNGYVLLEDGKICEDINECQDINSLHNCTQNASCTNLPGTFNCTCDPGFEGDPYSSCMDINECENLALCSEQCNNTDGSFFCSCSAGFEIGDDGETCEDIDECMLKTDNCERSCVNVLGSFNCKCPTGFDLSPDNFSCSVTPSSACDDTNGGCSDTCVNSSGIVTCYCPVGYNLTSDQKTCEDINECATDNGGCIQQCTNNNGSFLCSCFSGYQFSSDGKYCEDVNECSADLHNCSQGCANRNGSFLCSCEDGYQLQPDGATCLDVNECSADLHNCSQGCANRNGSFLCSCEDGYQLQPDGATCLDINECTSGASLCGDAACSNVDGSFRCDCESPLQYNQGKCQAVRGFVFTFTLLQLDGMPVEYHSALLNHSSREFVKLEEAIQNQMYVMLQSFPSFILSRILLFRNGSVIAQLALYFDENATNITQDAITAAFPQNGVIGNLTYRPQTAQVSDLDECAEEIHDCHEKAICSNKPGTFECKCKDGYQGDGKNNCEPAPEEDETDDADRKRTLAIILGVVFGILVVFIFVLLLYFLRRNRGHENIAKDGKGKRLNSRTGSSDVGFPMAEKRSGSYDVNPAVPGDNLSGDYDYPDPHPGGWRNSHYDNPAVEQERDGSRAGYETLERPPNQDDQYSYIDM